MVSKISQGGYGTVYRGVLEPWLAQIYRKHPGMAPQKRQTGQMFTCNSVTQEPKVDRAGGAFQAELLGRSQIF